MLLCSARFVERGEQHPQWQGPYDSSQEDRSRVRGTFDQQLKECSSVWGEWPYEVRRLRLRQWSVNCWCLSVSGESSNFATSCGQGAADPQRAVSLAVSRE